MKRSDFFLSLLTLPVTGISKPEPELTDDELKYLQKVKRNIVIDEDINLITIGALDNV